MRRREAACRKTSQLLSTFTSPGLNFSNDPSKLKGQTPWLEMLKSDEELIAESNTSVEVIRSNATQLLSSLSSQEGSVSAKLWKAYNDTDDIVTHCVIGYLLKNGSKVPKKLEENLEKLAKRRRKVEIKIERLKRQLESRIPSCRDLTGKNWLETKRDRLHNCPQR